LTSSGEGAETWDAAEKVSVHRRQVTRPETTEKGFTDKVNFIEWALLAS
jgi:hypothetical protein